MTKNINVYFYPPEFSVIKIRTWKCHVEESSEIRYDMILGRDPIMELLLDIEFDKRIMVSGEGPFGGDTAPTVNLLK